MTNDVIDKLLDILKSYEVGLRDSDGHWFVGVESKDYENIISDIVNKFKIETI